MKRPEFTIDSLTFAKSRQPTVSPGKRALPPSNLTASRNANRTISTGRNTPRSIGQNCPAAQGGSHEFCGGPRESRMQKSRSMDHDDGVNSGSGKRVGRPVAEMRRIVAGYFYSTAEHRSRGVPRSFALALKDGQVTRFTCSAMAFVTARSGRYNRTPLRHRSMRMCRCLQWWARWR